MSHQPAMSFDADALLDKERMKAGPIDFFWNQDEWIEPGEPMDLNAMAYLDPPKLLWRVLRYKPWLGVVRMAPPQGVGLREWGHNASDKLGVPFGTADPDRGHKAMWIAGGIWAPNAHAALGSFGNLFKKLDGVQSGQVAVRIMRWPDDLSRDRASTKKAWDAANAPSASTGGEPS